MNLNAATTRGVVAAIIDGLMALVAIIILWLYSPTLTAVLIVAVRAATTVKIMGREAERESVWRNL